MNNNNVLISFIVPVYNVELYLKDCIESVLKLNISFELILINDGSTDNSGKICDYYSKKYSNIIYIYQKNSGPAIARNKGLKHAIGKYICFLDSDDMIDKDALMNNVSILKNKNYDILYGNNYTILYPGNTRKEVKYKYPIFCNGKELIKSILKKGPRMCISYIWINIYRKDFIIENNIFFKENIKLGEDTDWNIRLFQKAKNIHSIQSGFYIYRGNRKGSLVTEKKYDTICSYFCLIDEWMKVENSDINLLIKEYFSDSFYSNLDYIYKFKKEDKKNLIEKIKIVIFGYIQIKL